MVPRLTDCKDQPSSLAPIFFFPCKSTFIDRAVMDEVVVGVAKEETAGGKEELVAAVDVLRNSCCCCRRFRLGG